MVRTNGAFIVIDGGEGAGKTTVAKEVVARLGWGAIYTREPGGSPYAEKIRDLVLSDEAKHSDAETQFALFWAGRRDHLKHTIVPALNDGKIVVTDRFDSSSYAYQIIAQEQSQLLDLFWAKRRAFIGEHEPDAYIILNVSPEVGLARVDARGSVKNHFDERKLDFHRRVNAGLLEFVEKHVRNGHVVNAEEELERVIERVLDIINTVSSS